MSGKAAENDFSQIFRNPCENRSKDHGLKLSLLCPDPETAYDGSVFYELKFVFLTDDVQWKN